MKFFNDNQFYPQHFYINAEIEDAEYTINCITEEAKELSPSLFNGDCSAFVFALKYVPTYEKIHNEVRRLQDCAAEHKRFCKNYKGYIVIVLSDFEGCYNEDNFSEFLKVLKAQSENWKYIFVTKNIPQHSKDELLKSLESLWVNEVECMVKRLDFNEINNSMQEDYNVSFQADCKPIIDMLMSNVLDNKSLCNLKYDVVNYYYEKSSISKEELIQYIDDKRTFTSHLLAEHGISISQLTKEKGEKNE